MLSLSLSLAIRRSSSWCHSHTAISLRSIHFAHPTSNFCHRIIRLPFLRLSNSRRHLGVVGFAGHSRDRRHAGSSFSHGATDIRVLPISLVSAARMAARLIVLEKFNFDDADGRPNSKDASVSRPKTQPTYRTYPLSHVLCFDQNCEATTTAIDILAFREREALLPREFKNLKTFINIDFPRSR